MSIAFVANRPSRVHIVEEGPREGFQSEPPGIPTAAKLALIEALAAAGLSEINCVSFVDPRRVPQMADAEAVAASIRRRPGTRFTGLWLNEKGFRRAQATGLDLDPVIVDSASDTFLIRNNNRSRAQSLVDQRRMLGLYREAGLGDVTAYIFTAFGCNYEGTISAETVRDRAADLLALADDEGDRLVRLYLCDTIGVADPNSVERHVSSLRDRFPGLEIALHLHDTRGLGLANALAALRSGVSRFDASCGGLGGCPFAGDREAAGNIATEDLVLLCEEMGIETGIDLPALIECARLAETIVGHRLPGRLMRVGPWPFARSSRPGRDTASRVAASIETISSVA